MRLTVTVAALVVGAPSVVAFDAVRALFLVPVLRALVVRANRFAALGFLAPAPVTLYVVSVVDQSVAVRAVEGVAVFRF